MIKRERERQYASHHALPARATTRCSARPAPSIATTMRLANRPPIIPKFDKVMVAPLSSSGGIERAAASARMRSSRARRSALSRSPTFRNTRHDQTAFEIDGEADVDASEQTAATGFGSYHALSEGSASQLPAIACTKSATSLGPSAFADKLGVLQSFALQCADGRG
jgi:hypothetical protein